MYTCAPAAAQESASPSAYEQIFSDPGFLAREQGFTASQKAGRKVWLYATAGNGRFHTYAFQQRLGVLIDWYRVLNSGQRQDRFKTWGLINDPGCCRPGDSGCPARNVEETYGFDWCPGDDELLPFVGRPGYRDPACDLEDAPVDAADGHGPTDQRHSACDLDFGTSTGALGLRKFPNPKFDADAWRSLNGSAGSWAGYQAQMDDGAVEPPYYVGMACGACHIAFDPLNPPDDPANPRWENITGLIGNQYARFAEIMASGMEQSTLEWQIFSHARPGTVDTSAVPNDGVNNPGTMNAIINVGKRPTHEHSIVKWRKAKSCPAGSDERTCWCEPGYESKCWQHGEQTEFVHNILKGGEDSIGALEAIQRVYINIGSCSEQAWVNHLVDLRQADPAQRLFHQTPFDIGQARRDCANFRAVEDRLGDILNFFMTARPTNLYQARGLEDPIALENELNAEFGDDAVRKGRDIFAAQCARCHSSNTTEHVLAETTATLEPVATRDFLAMDPDNPGLRLDFMGNDEMVPASEVGTYHARALHSNHMTGHIWQEYGSETLRAKSMVDVLPEVPVDKDGGRGYYRNISLLSVWAHAPFMHNNAIGPEICGSDAQTDPSWSADPERNLYRSPYVALDGEQLAFDDDGLLLDHAAPADCWPYDPSVEGRYALFKASTAALLNPKQRDAQPKVTRISEHVIIPIGPRYIFDDDGRKRGLEVVIPRNTPAIFVANLKHKELITDLVLAATNRPRLKEKLTARWGAQAPQVEALLDRLIDSRVQQGVQDRIGKLLGQIERDVPGDPTDTIVVMQEHRQDVQRYYSRSTALIENVGHRFGEGLSAADKDALTAFLATL